MATSDSTRQLSLVEAWEALQAVPSYVEQQARIFASEPLPIDRVCEDDLKPHIEDTPLFWVSRAGYPVQVAYNKLTQTDRQQLQEAEHRTSYCLINSIYE